MIRRIEGLLKANAHIHDYKIIELDSLTYEGYFIKRDIEMTRNIETKQYEITIYIEDSKDGQAIKRQVSFTLEDAVSEDEIKQAIDSAVYKAQFVSIKDFQLVQGDGIEKYSRSEGMQDHSLSSYVALVAQAIFAADHHQEGFINSCEIFIEQKTTHILNSKGVNLKHLQRSLGVEFIITWGNKGQEVELYNFLRYPAGDLQSITEEVEKQFMRAKDRYMAQYTPALANINVLIHPKEIHELMNYFVAKASARSIYQKTSNYHQDKVLQNQTQGDTLSITLTPFDPSSTRALPFDGDGVILNKLNLIHQGKVVAILADNMHGQYLKLPITGNISNMEVSVGKTPMKNLRKEPYLEIVSFSGLDVDIFSGNFGGEIRLGYYFDGQKTIPVTGGSIAGDMEEVLKEFYFSYESTRENGYFGPKLMLLKKINIVKGK